MGDGLTIQLEVYLPFREKGIWRGEEAIPAGTTAAALLDLLALTEPELVVLVNGRHLPDGSCLRDGDEVAILRQAEGGA